MGEEGNPIDITGERKNPPVMFPTVTERKGGGEPFGTKKKSEELLVIPPAEEKKGGEKPPGHCGRWEKRPAKGVKGRGNGVFPRRERSKEALREGFNKGDPAPPGGGVFGKKKEHRQVPFQRGKKRRTASPPFPSGNEDSIFVSRKKGENVDGRGGKKKR